MNHLTIVALCGAVLLLPVAALAQHAPAKKVGAASRPPAAATRPAPTAKPKVAAPWPAPARPPGLTLITSIEGDSLRALLAGQMSHSGEVKLLADGWVTYNTYDYIKPYGLYEPIAPFIERMKNQTVLLEIRAQGGVAGEKSEFAIGLINSNNRDPKTDEYTALWLRYDENNHWQLSNNRSRAHADNVVLAEGKVPPALAPGPHTLGLLMRHDSIRAYVDDRPVTAWLYAAPVLRPLSWWPVHITLESGRPTLRLQYLRCYAQGEAEAVAARAATAERARQNVLAAAAAKRQAAEQEAQTARRATQAAEEETRAEAALKLVRAEKDRLAREAKAGHSSTTTSSNGVQYSTADMSMFSKVVVCLALLRSDNTVNSIECFEFPGGTSREEAVAQARDRLSLSNSRPAGVYFSENSTCDRAKYTAQNEFRAGGGNQVTPHCN